MLIDYLREADIPVVWTLHDSWAYTGHCAYYHYPIKPYTTPAAAPHAAAPTACLRWQKGCERCPLKRSYPASYVLDQSSRNYMEKWSLFTSLRRLALATPSQWLHNEAAQSFLGSYPIHTLPNAIDLSVFTPCCDERLLQRTILRYGLDKLGERRLVLSVAAKWDERKGLEDLKALSKTLGPGYCVVAVGLDEKQRKSLPEGMLGLPRTADVQELCALYTAADLYVSMSQGETMGMTLLEAMACGTQVLCYDSSAMPELLTPDCGETVPVGDIAAAADAVRILCSQPKDPLACMERAARYTPDRCYEGYMELYRQV
jgi:glycosyltransferase involved in cell wall biosynthesis